MSRRPLLALTMGDPAGVGPEIVLRLIETGPIAARLLVIGDAGALQRARSWRGAPPLPPVVDGPEAVRTEGHEVALWAGAQDLGELPEVGRVDARAGAASHRWVVAAADLAQADRVEGMVTGPIHKEAWHAAGVESPGHTEALRDRAGVSRVQMLFVAKRLRVALATIHVPLSRVPSMLGIESLQDDLHLLHDGLQRHLGVGAPRLAVCGLNPHAGEGRLFGEEDATVIAPAVEGARARGVDVVGPLPADACIPAACEGRYDGVLAMYHDQALPAVKSVAPRSSVNVTLGLPFIRTSVDHGTAFDIAGTGRASASSLRAAVELGAQMAATRARRI